MRNDVIELAKIGGGIEDVAEHDAHVRQAGGRDHSLPVRNFLRRVVEPDEFAAG